MRGTADFLADFLTVLPSLCASVLWKSLEAERDEKKCLRH